MRLCTLTALIFAGATIAADPPKGFTPLFNGKDLTGWHGMPHFNPYELDKMPEEKRKALEELAKISGRPPV